MAAPTLSSLRGISQFQSGVGGGDDLATELRETLSGRWFPRVRPGYFFLGTEEGYRYAVEGRQTFTVTSTGTIRYLTLTGLSRDPTELGPVRIVRSGATSGTVAVIQRVASPLRAYRPFGLTGTGTVQTGSATGLLFSLVTDPVSGVYLSVAATGDLHYREEYVYERETNRVYLRDLTPPRLWASYLVGEADPEFLKQEEIVCVDRDGLVRVSRSPVCMFPGFKPVLRRPGRTGTYTVTGSAASQNVVTFSGIASGQLAAVEYYVLDGFTAVPSGTPRGATLELKFLPSATGEYAVLWEAGDGKSGWYDTSQLASGSTEWLQLNPILTHREPGFLFLTDRSESWRAAAKLQLSASTQNPLYHGSGSRPLFLTVTAYDPEGYPAPQQTLGVTITGVAGTLTRVEPTANTTNSRGQQLFRWLPTAVGSALVTAVVSGTAVSGTLILTVRAEGDYFNQQELRLGKLLLVRDEVPSAAGHYRLTACWVYPDGVQYQPHDASDGVLPAVNFLSERSRFFTGQGQPLASKTAVPLNADGLAVTWVAPLPGDIVRAMVSTTDQGGTLRQRWSAPLHFGEAETEDA